MLHIPIHLTGEAMFALICAAGIIAPFLMKFTEADERPQPKPQSRDAQVKRSDDPATLALVKQLQSQR